MAKELISETKFKPNEIVYRYRLEPYKSLSSRHICPSCGKKHSFARYIDLETGEYLGDDIGRCNAESSCGYHRPPKATDLKPGSELLIPKALIDERLKGLVTDSSDISIIDSKFVMESMTNVNNSFTQYLFKHFDPIKVFETIHKYKIGSSDKWDDSVVFWQIDRDYDARTGKIMQYDTDTCKRIKDDYGARINWCHRAEIYPDFNLKQCFFGEHLLNNEPRVVKVVESEKTAIICDLANTKDDVIWVATGGLNNINESRLSPFSENELIFFPDKGDAYHKWERKLKPFEGSFNIKISNFLEKTDLSEGEDLADYFLKKFN